MTLVSWRRRLGSTPLVFLASVTLASAQTKTGAELYESACRACHAADGKGTPHTIVGFDTPLPDFTDCAFTSAEPDVDWISVVHSGGAIRAFDRKMPAFGRALSSEEIHRVVDYVRGFCSSTAWPTGNLNLPRSLVTEKAFPDNEAIVTTAAATSFIDRVETRFEYERRLGPRSQYELTVPLNVVKFPGRGWNRGLGDIELGFKHVVFADASRGSIVSGALDVTLPTGKETEGLGNRLLVVEPFGAFSQMLPHDLFLHGQLGMALPLNIESVKNEVFWRVAGGKTFTEPRWGRAWTPIVELLAARDIGFDEKVRWDLMPELLVTLSRRQHVMASGGVRLPLTIRTRNRTVAVALLWEWTQGSLWSGW